MSFCSRLPNFPVLHYIPNIWEGLLPRGRSSNLLSIFCIFLNLVDEKWYLNLIFFWTSLVVEWIKICLPMQGTQVWSLVWEDLTCRRATKPVCHNSWACMLKLLQPLCLEHVLCNKKPPRWESLCLQQSPSTTKKIIIILRYVSY